jgi:hypothetical protein
LVHKSDIELLRERLFEEACGRIETAVETFVASRPDTEMLDAVVSVVRALEHVKQVTQKLLGRRE